jgi:hypothetical protein
VSDESERVRLKEVLKILSESGPRHSLEMHLYREFGLGNSRELQCLALFLLAHAALDRFLIKEVVEDRIKRREAPGESSHSIESTAAKGSFWVHLTEAVSRGLIDDNQKRIASTFNEARNGFLHWGPNRTELPRYKGKTVASAEGTRLWMTDAIKFFDQREGPPRRARPDDPRTW